MLERMRIVIAALLLIGLAPIEALADELSRSLKPEMIALAAPILWAEHGSPARGRPSGGD
jgi:hypothetical protein